MFLLMLLLVNQTNEYLAVRSDVFDWHFYKELNVIILSIEGIIAVNYSMLIRLMPLSYDSVVSTFDFQSLCCPLGVKLIELIVFIEGLCIKALPYLSLRGWNLPIF